MSLDKLHDQREATIAKKLVKDILAAGCQISVWEGEGWALTLSVDEDKILESMSSTDSDVLIIRSTGKAPPYPKIGSVTLIYGNGTDLISDYAWVATDARNTEDVVKQLMIGAEHLAEKLEG